MTITPDSVAVLVVTLIQFGIGVGVAMAGWYLTGYIRDIWRKRSAR